MKKFLLVMVLCLISVVSSFGQVSFSKGDDGSFYRTISPTLIGSSDCRKDHLIFSMQYTESKDYCMLQMRFSYLYQKKGELPRFVGVNIELEDGESIKYRSPLYSDMGPKDFQNLEVYPQEELDGYEIVIQVTPFSQDLYDIATKKISKIYMVCLSSNDLEYKIDVTDLGREELRNQCGYMLCSF